MADQVEIQAPKTKWLEGSSFSATAYFRTRSTSAADTPDSVRYRIDCLTTGKTVQDWTSASAASSVTVSVTSTHNAIQDASNRYERKQLTVEGDTGLSNQSRGLFVWTVENIRGF